MQDSWTVQSRQLGRHLRDLRRQSGVSADAVASELQLHPASIYRFETGKQIPRLLYVTAMCKAYGADEQMTAALVALAREADSPGWWRSYNGGVPKWFDVFIGLEAVASHIRAYDADVILGLLQTRRYAEATVRVSVPTPTADEQQQRVAVRMERQRLLTRRNPPKLDVILGEAALAKSPGNEIMAEQLQKLIDVSHQRDVSIRILPLANVHCALDCGARFTCLTFPPDRRGEAEPPVVFTDNLTGALYLDKPADIAAYDAVWEALRPATLSPADSRQVITDYMERYRQ